MVTPWMLKNDKLQDVLCSGKTRAQVQWFFIDEAHLVNKSDPSVWLEPYASLLLMRARLPSTTIWAAMTGTATRSETLYISHSLGFRPGLFKSARHTVDRKNIKFIPRFLAHPVSGSQFLDLSFLVPLHMTSSADIPTTLLFCDTIELGHRIMCFLDSLLPHNLPNRNQIVMPCNGLLELDERDSFKTDLESGLTRIGVVTDTCTYGYDIRVRRVVTFSVSQVPAYSKLYQQWGRVARDGTPGVVYAFVPCWVRIVPPETITTTQQKEDAARRKTLPQVILKFFNSSSLTCPRDVHLAHNDEELQERPVSCCSLHQPEPEQSADAALVSAWTARRAPVVVPKERAPRSDGTYKPLEPEMKAALTRLLQCWRVTRWQQLRPPGSDAPSIRLLPNQLVTRLGDKLHVCTDFDRFKKVIGPWRYLDSEGARLFELVTEFLQGLKEILQDRVMPAPDEHEVVDPEETNAVVAAPDVGRVVRVHSQVSESLGWMNL